MNLIALLNIIFAKEKKQNEFDSAPQHHFQQQIR